jgi:two-component system sensor histidine kinase KdpD
VALTLLMLVLFLAARFGLRYAVATSIVATVCYNYYFLPRKMRVSGSASWRCCMD